MNVIEASGAGSGEDDGATLDDAPGVGSTEGVGFSEGAALGLPAGVAEAPGGQQGTASRLAGPPVATAHDDQDRHHHDHQRGKQAGHDDREVPVVHLDASYPTTCVTPGGVDPSQDQTPGDHGRLIDRPASPCPAQPGRSPARLGTDDPSRHETTEESKPRVQATRIRPDTRPTDLRRLAAAGLSAVIPGLGQLVDRRTRLAALFLVPSLILIAIGLVLIQTQSPARLAAWVASPPVLGAVLTLNLLILAWRLVAVGQAFLDTSRTGPTGRLGIIGLVVIAILVVIPHLAVYRYGTILGDTFGKIFTGATLGDDRGAGSGPGDDQRLNVLLIGVDALKTRTETLTDTMMVASLDPVGHTVSLLSIPRDLIDTPLGNGNTYGPKLNSLMSYADAHPKAFPKGGIRTLEDAVGALLGIEIHYYARLDFVGFIKMIDAVGGVDIDVPRGFEDPTYDGYGMSKAGYSITAGLHHFDGVGALAYARSRKALGESDFTRQARQQQILVALRAKATQGGSLLFELPALLDAVGQTIRSDLPADRLPALAAIMDEVGRNDVTSVVIRSPLVHPKSTRFGDSQEPDLARILAVAAGLFSGTRHATVTLADPEADPVAETDEDAQGDRDAGAQRAGARPSYSSTTYGASEASDLGRAMRRLTGSAIVGPGWPLSPFQAPEDSDGPGLGSERPQSRLVTSARRPGRRSCRGRRRRTVPGASRGPGRRPRGRDAPA